MRVVLIWALLASSLASSADGATFTAVQDSDTLGFVLADVTVSLANDGGMGMVGRLEIKTTTRQDPNVLIQDLPALRITRAATFTPNQQQAAPTHVEVIDPTPFHAWTRPWIDWFARQADGPRVMTVFCWQLGQGNSVCGVDHTDPSGMVFRRAIDLMQKGPHPIAATRRWLLQILSHDDHLIRWSWTNLQDLRTQMITGQFQRLSLNENRQIVWSVGALWTFALNPLDALSYRPARPDSMRLSLLNCARHAQTGNRCATKAFSQFLALSLNDYYSSTIFNNGNAARHFMLGDLEDVLGGFPPSRAMPNDAYAAAWAELRTDRTSCTFDINAARETLGLPPTRSGHPSISLTSEMCQKPIGSLQFDPCFLAYLSMFWNTGVLRDVHMRQCPSFFMQGTALLSEWFTGLNRKKFNPTLDKDWFSSFLISAMYDIANSNTVNPSAPVVLTPFRRDPTGRAPQQWTELIDSDQPWNVFNLFGYCSSRIQWVTKLYRDLSRELAGAAHEQTFPVHVTHQLFMEQQFSDDQVTQTLTCMQATPPGLYPVPQAPNLFWTQNNIMTPKPDHTLSWTDWEIAFILNNPRVFSATVFVMYDGPLSFWPVSAWDLQRYFGFDAQLTRTLRYRAQDRDLVQQVSQAPLAEAHRMHLFGGTKSGSPTTQDTSDWSSDPELVRWESDPDAFAGGSGFGMASPELLAQLGILTGPKKAFAEASCLTVQRLSEKLKCPPAAA